MLSLQACISMPGLLLGGCGFECWQNKFSHPLATISVLFLFFINGDLGVHGDYDGSEITVFLLRESQVSDLL